MGNSDNELRVPIGIPVQTDAAAAAGSIEELRDKIAASKEAIGKLSAANRDLKGSSDAVKAAKDQLKAKIDSEKAAITESTLKLLAQGNGYEKLAEKSKAAEKAATTLTTAKKKETDASAKALEASKKNAESAKKSSEAMSKAIGAAGGPVASLKGKLEGLDTALGGSEGGMAALAGLASIAAAAIVAVSAAAASAAYSIGKFIIVSADAARMMQLTRKANLSGNDTWAKNLGDQIDELARKVPVAKEKLNELGISLAKSRIGGRTMIDTLNAVAGASAAAGDDLGNKLKGIVERGALTRRFQLSPQELLGMDLDFSDVAKAYAQGMHISVEAARQALFEGRVRLQDGAAALRAAVEKKFGGINADKMLGLDNLATKFRQDLAGLAKDVNLEPLLKGLAKLEKNFDTSTVNGKALKGIVETIGRSIGVSFDSGVGPMQAFIDKAVWGALKLENYWLRAEVAVKKYSNGSKTLEGSLLAITMPIVTIITWIDVLTNAWKAIPEKLAHGIALSEATLVGFKDTIANLDWAATGRSIVDGLIDGIKSGSRELLDKIGALGEDIKKVFTRKLEIQSPSKVMRRYGKEIPEGGALGVEDGTPRLRAAVADMADVRSMSSGGLGGGGGSRGPVSITISPTIIVQGGGGESIREQLKDPSLLHQLTEELVAAIRAAGIEVPA